MHVVVAGGTGFIGSALSCALKKRGDTVTILSRTGGEGRVTWKEGIPPCDAIVNLCGEGILNHRWNSSIKEIIYDSRVVTTRRLVEMLPSPFPFLLNASAVGYYPVENKAPCTEGDGPGKEFLGRLCADWEAAAQSSPGKTAVVRIAVALSKGGGSFRMLHRTFKWGLGGKVGSGRQGFPWIHLDDLISLFLFILDSKREGVFNGAAPDPITNAEFTKALGKKLHRPTFCRVPDWLLRMGLGEGADAVTKGALVYPERALREGFTFRYPTLERALEDLTHG